MKKKIVIVISVILGFLFLTGIIAVKVLTGPNVRIGYKENSYGNRLDASFFYFNGTNNKKVKFEKGDKVTMNYSIELKKGTLKVSLKDKEGKEVFSKSEGSGKETFTVTETQSYLIEITASKANGKYELTWSKW